MKHYDVGNRDIIGQGRLYVDHVEAMTAEALHSQSDIAAELAHRDIRIRQLQDSMIRYGEHDLECTSRVNDCNCGFRAALTPNDGEVDA